MRFAVEPDRFADYTGIGSETPAPKRITDHHEFVCAGLIVALRESPPELGFDAQNLKDRPRAGGTLDAFGRAVAGQVERGGVPQRRGLTGTALFLPGPKVRGVHGQARIHLSE